MDDLKRARHSSEHLHTVIYIFHNHCVSQVLWLACFPNHIAAVGSAEVPPQAVSTVHMCPTVVLYSTFLSGWGPWTSSIDITPLYPISTVGPGNLHLKKFLLVLRWVLFLPLSLSFWVWCFLSSPPPQWPWLTAVIQLLSDLIYFFLMLNTIIHSQWHVLRFDCYY